MAEGGEAHATHFIMTKSAHTYQMEGVFVKCQGSTTLLVTLSSMKNKIKVGKERAMAVYKVVEAYLLENPAAYA
ncbi:hypothetical protein CFP56_027015 [Quercus suber]|uniref:Uncharacterized protein n=1 Tax=Quercus suber TaxID=58331 RepID=A0AAW0JYG1_QUESU